MQDISIDSLGHVFGGEGGPPNPMVPALSDGGGQGGSPNVTSNMVPSTIGSAWSGNGSGIPNASVPLVNRNGTWMRQTP